MIRWSIIIESLIATIILSIFLVDSVAKAYIPILLFVAFYFGLILLYFVYIFIFSLFFPLSTEYRTQNKFVNFTVVSTLGLLNDLGHVKIKTSGLEKVPHNEKFMLVYNHTSNFDPIVQSYVLRKDNLIHVSKPSNFKIPIAGKMVHRNCYISINRENDREALKSIHLASKYISDQKYCVSISPEGTRNKNDVSKLLNFRPGCFNLALMAKCPIVVCEMYGLNKISKNFPFKRSVVEMNVIDVIPYEEIKDSKAVQISKRVFEELQNKIDSRKEK